MPGRLAFAEAVEAAALAILKERKPDRSLQTNVEFYTALLLEALAFPPDGLHLRLRHRPRRRLDRPRPRAAGRRPPDPPAVALCGADAAGRRPESASAGERGSAATESRSRWRWRRSGAIDLAAMTAVHGLRAAPETAALTRRVTLYSVAVAAVLVAIKVAAWLASRLGGAAGLDGGLRPRPAGLADHLLRGALRGRPRRTPSTAIGHGKAEGFASLVQAGLVFASAALIGQRGDRRPDPSAADPGRAAGRWR